MDPILNAKQTIAHPVSIATPNQDNTDAEIERIARDVLTDLVRNVECQQNSFYNILGTENSSIGIEILSFLSFESLQDFKNVSHNTRDLADKAICSRLNILEKISFPKLELYRKALSSIKGTPYDLAAVLRNCNKLTQLNLYDFEGNDEQLAAIIQATPQIEKVILCIRSKLSEDGLDNIRQWRHLTHFSLHGYQSDLPILVIATLARCKQLNTLNFMYSSLNDECLRLLCNVQHFPNLTTLNLVGCFISDINRGLSHFANSKICSLGLNGGLGITDEGVAHLKNIEKLALVESCYVTDEGIARLEACKTLDISFSSLITGEGVLKLKNCKAVDQTLSIKFDKKIISELKARGVKVCDFKFNARSPERRLFEITPMFDI